jgi:outer membrane protein OmpA-like peptidoglycan-associated protein/tetratricopeptide (TPR) repeat protein
MIKYLKYFLFTTASLVICNLFGQSVEPHFNPDEDSTHIIKIRKSDGTIEYFKHGVLINLDTSYKGEDFELADSFETNDSLKNSKYTLKNAPIFEYGIGKTDKVAIDWGNYHFEKESYKKAISRFSEVQDKSLDVLRKLGKSYLNTNLLDSAEKYFQIVADTTNSPSDLYNYSHILYMNEKFDKAEEVRKQYANSSDEKRAEIFNKNSSHKELLNTVSKIDLQNLSINTKNSDFGAYAVKNDSSDSYTVLFTSADEYSIRKIKKSKFVKPDQPTYDLFKTEFQFPSMELSSPNALSGELKNQYQEGPAIMSEDQKTIYYTRSNSLESENQALYLSMYKVNVDHLNTQDSVLGLSINNDNYSVMHPTITKDGERMYFASDMPGGFGGMDLYYCEIFGLYKQFFLGDTATGARELVRLSQPVNLGNQINTEGNEVFPFQLDDQTLFYASDGRIGFGGLDIFMANNYMDTTLIENINLGKPFNSSKDDFSFFMSRDLKFGFLSSNRPGGKGDDDIYCFKTNINLSEGVDDYYTMVYGQKLEVTKNSVLANDFIEDTVQGVLGQKLLYRAALTSDPSHGKVKFNDDGTFVYTPENENVTSDKFTYRLVHNAFSDNDINVFINSIDNTIPVATNDHYAIKKGENFEVNSEKGTLHNDYDPGNDSLSTILITPPLHGELKFNENGSFKYIPEDYFVLADTFYYAVTDGHFYDTAEVTLARLITGVDIATIIEIEPIYFDVNKSNIRDDAAHELDKIVNVMNEYSEMVVELGSHTDCRASKNYNSSLSKRRAKSSAIYIKARISNPERIYGKGYGESKLKNKCECEGSRIVPCSEEEHQENRRTEFVIVKM